MDKSVKKLVLSIIFVVFLVGVSIPLWNFSSASQASKIAGTYSNLDVSVNVDAFSSLVVIDDDKAMDYVKPSIISLRNQNKNQKQYELVLSIDKLSTLDYKYVRLSLNDRIYDLSNIEVEEDKDNYYFVLEKGLLDGYTSKEMEGRIWVTSNAKNLDTNITLTTNFLTK